MLIYKKQQMNLIEIRNKKNIYLLCQKILIMNIIICILKTKRYIYYIKNKNIPIARLKLAKNAFSISMPKYEDVNILRHCIKYI